MPLNRIIWQQKNKLPQKILSVYKYTTLKIVVTPSFNVSVVVFLIIKIGSQAWDSLLFVPPGRCANSSQNCHPCSFCSHKQRCWTVLSELWPKVAFNSNTFFLNWKQWITVKALKIHALQYTKMYVVGVSAKTADGYLKIFEEQVIRLHSNVWTNL